MATTRLRRAFRYPTEDDPNEPSEGIDEEEQEKLIHNLQNHDESSTKFYTTAFVALPLLATLSYIPSILVPSSKASLLSAVLSVSSLVATAYILYFLPIAQGNKSQSRSGLKKWAEDNDGPLNRYLIALNGALTLVLGFRGYVEGRRTGWSETEGFSGVLPLVIYLFILLVRWQLKPVDIESVGNMRYSYKGA